MATKDDPEQRAEALKALTKVAELLDQADAEFSKLAAALGVELDGEAGKRTAVAKEYDHAGVDRELAGLLA